MARSTAPKMPMKGKMPMKEKDMTRMMGDVPMMRGKMPKKKMPMVGRSKAKRTPRGK